MPDRTCSIESCERKSSSRGWCRMHYARWQRHGDPLITLLPNFIVGTDEERFWGKVGPETATGCRPWIGSRDNHGYGNFKFEGNIAKAHRVAYQLTIGMVPAGMLLDHLCHNQDVDCPGGPSCPHRLCVNPDHLEPVTNLENIRRGRLGATRKEFCKRGHAFDESNTRWTKEGYRECRACRRMHSRAWYEKKRSEVPPETEGTSLL